MIGEAQPSFAAACGSTSPLVLGVQTTGGSVVSWRTFDQPFAVVGRAPDADLSLEGAEVSRRHAYFQVVAGRILCMDLHSRTGTHANDEPGRWGSVNPAAAVRIGPHHIQPSNGDPRTPLPGSCGFEPTILPAITLEIANRAGATATWQANQSLLLIGRSPACKVALDGPGIANIHASLVRTASGVFVVDLLAPGGVLVNDRPVRWARLGSDDLLTVGEHKIQVRGGSSGRVFATPAPTLPASSPPIRADPTAARVQAVAAELEPGSPPATEPVDAGVLNILQSIVTLQQEQMTLLREELAEIRRLAVEQAELGRRDQDARGPRVLRVVAGESRTRAPLSVPVPRSGGGSGPPRGPLAIQGEASSPASHDAQAADGASGDDAFHAQVFDRLAQIQTEGQNRWQWLRETMLGKPS